MNKTVLIVLVVIILLAGGLFFVQSQNQTTEPTDTTQVEQTQPTNAMEAPDENEAMEADPTATEEGTVKEFTIEGGDFSFTPNAITVNQGDTVRITLVSNDMMHDLVIDELDVATSQLAAGEQETIEFVADQAGTFEFYCSVGNHREMGMVGTLTVQ